MPYKEESPRDPRFVMRTERRTVIDGIDMLRNEIVRVLNVPEGAASELIDQLHHLGYIQIVMLGE